MSAGDGAFAFLPLFMTPTKLKEFLLLGPSWTARTADPHETRCQQAIDRADELDA
jgi:hypothetical protein